jgi:Leucine-rich repeat (LRR) protein
VNTQTITKETEKLLLSLQPQLIWLKMPGIRLSDSSWQKLAGLDKLTKLSIEHSNISDSSIGYIKSLSHLQYLNLVDTKITRNGLMQLKGLQELANVYLGQTNIPRNEWPLLQKAFPTTILDSGGYKVTSLATDTQLLKAKPVKK